MAKTTKESYLAIEARYEAIKAQCRAMSDDMGALRIKKGRHDKFEWPEPVREAAFGMVSSVNKFTVMVGFDLDELRIAMGIELDE